MGYTVPYDLNIFGLDLLILRKYLINSIQLEFSFSVQIKVYKHLMAFRCCIEIAVEQFRRGRGDIAVMSLALSCSNPGNKQDPAPPLRLQAASLPSRFFKN